MKTTLDEQNAAEILGMVRQLAAAYRQEADKYTQQAYLLGLADLPIEQVRTAVLQAIRGGDQFMPTVATLRRLAGAELSTKSRAVVAFDALGAAVTQHGAYKSVRFDDPILNTTVQSLGGWVRICATLIDEWDSHFRHRFMEAYQGNLEAKRGTMYAGLGIAAVENTGAGYETNLPILVSVAVPKLPGLFYQMPEERQHLLRGATGLLANHIGKIDQTTNTGETR